MKYIKMVSISVLIVLMIMSISCKKFLNDMPNDTLPEDSMFSNLKNTEGVLAQIYANLPDPYVNNRGGSGGHDGHYNYIADDGNLFTHSEYVALQFNESRFTPTFTDFKYIWQEFYKKVRTCTYFIEHIDGANPAEVSDFLKAHFKAEARAMRAIFYFWMLRLYGPVVILPDVIPVNGSNEDILRQRTPFDSCVNYIVGQLDSAYAEMKAVSSANHPADQPYNEEYGRVTSGVCKAYKLQTLLLAASPLFNGNPAYVDVANHDGTRLFSQAYDPGKWKLAADAAKDFIDEFVPNTYDLYTVQDSDPFMAAYLACKNVVSDDWNKEWIFGVTMRGSVGDYVYQCTPKLVGYGSSVYKGTGYYAASKNIVDAYNMRSGRPITDPLSGYQKSGFSSFKAPFDVKARSTFNQWVNREPRFYVGITYNNSYWQDQGSSDKEVVVNMERSGNSGKVQSVTDVASTGFIVRKNVTKSRSARGWVYIRLAQIYLDYAEALNETDPGHPDILKYLNKVRIRAGIPAYGEQQGEIPLTATQSAVRKAIHKERQIELAFEEKRYFDLRRWKAAATYLNETIYGMNMDGDGEAFYETVPVKTLRFKDRDYLWAIPDDEIRRDARLVQNPGW